MSKECYNLYDQLRDACETDNDKWLKTRLTPDMLLVYNPFGTDRFVLELCAAFGSFKCVNFILEEFGHILPHNILIDSLSEAVHFSRTECVAFILKYCTREMINSRDKFGHYPLWYAIKKIRYNVDPPDLIINMLIDYGASVETACDGFKRELKLLRDYENDVQMRKLNCEAACGSLLFAFKRRGAPRDATRWIVQQYVKSTRTAEEWNIK